MITAGQESVQNESSEYGVKVETETAAYETTDGPAQAPEDRFNLVFITFVLLGTGLLFPWNAVITAVDFFNTVQFPGENIEFLFTVAYMSTNFCGLILMLRWGMHLSFRVRIIPGLLFFVVAMAILPFSSSKGLSVGLVCGLGILDSLVQGSLFGLAAKFPPKYVSGTMQGLGVAGVVVGLLRVMTKGSFPDTHDGIRYSSYVYFFIAVFTVLLAVVGYFLILERSPFAKFYMRDKTGLSDPLLANTDSDIVEVVSDAQPATESTGPVSLRVIWGKIWHLALSVTLVFWVSLAVFPGLTSEMTSTSASLNATGWYSVILITLFDFGDLIGRTLTNWPRLIVVRGRGLAVMVVVRLVFIALFVMSIKRVVFVYDFLHYIIMLLFAISNGYCGTLAMMFASDSVANHEKEHAGTLMVFLLTFGLTGGVWTGYIINTVFGV